LIFKYLITHRGQAISKDVLMNIFWPDAELEAARRNLHQAIYALRQTLRVKNSNFQPVLFENDCYRFNSELNLWLDYEEFEQHSRAGQAFEQNHQAEEAMTEYGIAEGLYRDHFLVEDLYEDWAQPHRETLWQTYLFISYRLAHYYLARSEHAAAIALCRRILAFDNSQEEAHLNLMKCYLSQGQRHLAINQYKLCVQALKEDLDIPPSAETRALYQQITKG
jgi:DNA-binding SARP family transcriptional activator